MKPKQTVIRRVYDTEAELIDPHTPRLPKRSARIMRHQTEDATPTIVLSTASPYKFARPVYEAVFGDAPFGTDDFEFRIRLLVAPRDSRR